MICKFVSHCTKNDKNFTISFLELMASRSRLHANQKLVSLFSSVVEKPFFLLLFRDFSFLISLFLFLNNMQKVEVQFTMRNFPKKNGRKIEFFPRRNGLSLSNAHCMYMLRYYGKLVRVIYGDIVNALGPIRISVSRWV